MRKPALALAAVFLTALVAMGQILPNLPANSVWGRLGIGTGPGQAIPFGTLGSFLNGGVCDVKTQGAVGNGTTDDTAAFSACITTVNVQGGGIVRVPPSTSPYCLFTGITVLSGVRIVGQDMNASQLSACGHDVQLITIGTSSPGGGRRAGLEHLTIFGKGTGGDLTFGATQKTVVVTSGSGLTVLESLQIAGGTIPLEVNAPDVIATDIHIGNLQPAGYGSAMLHITRGGWYRRISLDNVWPQSIPSVGFASSVPARANSTGYTAGQLVTLSGYYLQCMTSGTSGGSPPALQNYGININDGTAVWQVVMAVGMAGILIDGTDGEVNITQLDLGTSESGVVINNATATQTKLTQALFSGPSLVTSISAQQGNGLTVTDSSISSGLLTTGTGITLGASWGGDTRIANNLFNTVGAYGVLINGSTNTTITGNTITGQTTAGIGVAAGVSHFTITGNALGTSANYGTNATPITIAAGSSNDYWIVGNDLAGATNPISDGGTGTVKYVPDTPPTTFTPSQSCGTATFTNAANTPRSKTLGKQTWAQVDFTITAIGTCTAPVTFTLPNTANSSGALTGGETVNGKQSVYCTVAAASATATCSKSANVAFGVNDRVVVSGTYENQ